MAVIYVILNYRVPVLGLECSLWYFVQHASCRCSLGSLTALHCAALRACHELGFGLPLDDKVTAVQCVMPCGRSATRLAALFGCARRAAIQQR